MKKFNPGDLVRLDKGEPYIELWSEPWDIIADPAGVHGRCDVSIYKKDVAMVVACRFYKGKKQEVYVIANGKSLVCGWITSSNLRKT